MDQNILSEASDQTTHEIETSENQITFENPVLYQRICQQWFVFSIVQGEVYYGKIAEESIREWQEEEVKNSNA